MGKKSKFPRLNLVIVGGKKVGKYSLREQYVKGWIAPKEFKKPESDCKVETIASKKYEVSVCCCDDIENPTESEIFKLCDGVLLVYSLSDKSSFSCIKASTFPTLHKKFGKNRSTSSAMETKDNGQTNEDVAESPTGSPEDVGLGIPVILVGNKADEAKLSRAVGTEEGEKLGKELSCDGFFETSATCNENVAKAFNSLAQEIVKHNEKLENTPQKQSAKPSKACCVIV